MTGERMFERGQIVKNPKQPSWGFGKVLELVGPNKVRVLFDDGNPDFST